MVSTVHMSIKTRRKAQRLYDRYHDFFIDLWYHIKFRLLYGSTESLEIFMLFALVLSGLWLLLPIDTFSTRTGFNVMDEVGRWVTRALGNKEAIPAEAAWGVILLINAALWAIGIARDNEPWTKKAAMMSIVIWAFISACFVLTDYRFLSTVVYPYYMIICIWVYLRVCR